MEDDIDSIFTCLECMIMIIGCIVIRMFFYFLALTWGMEGLKRILMKRYHKDISIEELQRKIDKL